MPSGSSEKECSENCGQKTRTTPIVGAIDKDAVLSVAAVLTARRISFMIDTCAALLDRIRRLRDRKETNDALVLAGFEEPSVPRAYLTMRATVAFHSSDVLALW